MSQNLNSLRYSHASAAKGLHNIAQGQRRSRATLGYQSRPPLNPNGGPQLLSFSLVIFILCASQVSAQLTIVESQDNNQPTVYKMTVSPVAEPQPALKYRFLVPPVDQIHANAATFYYKAMVFEGPDMWRQELQEKIDAWREAPLETLPLKEIAEKVLWYSDQTAWQPLHEAATCDHCDWGDPIREFGAVTLLPQAQKMRSVARGIAVRARTEIAGGDYSKAIGTLGLGYSLSRNMGHGCCIVQSLIGIAIENILDDQTLTLMAAKNSPNLYWPLADLAAQPVDLRQAMSYETHFWQFTVHELADLDARDLSAEEAVNLGQKVWSMLSGMRAGKVNNNALNEAGLLLWCLQTYPEAKEYLLSHGFNEARIDAMPVLQTVLLYRWKQYQQLSDDYFKWLLLPDDEMRLALKEGEDRVDQLITRGVGAPFAASLPAIRASINAQWRMQRNINMIQLIEALRLYAAGHGTWPEKLSDIAEVPAPRDPWTQKPFEYSVTDGVAIIQAPREPKAPWPENVDQRYELTLRSKSFEPPESQEK